MNQYTMFSERANTLYIDTSSISPSYKGMSIKEARKTIDMVMKMPYEERILRYADEMAKYVILKEIDAHRGCKLSEFTTPRCGI